MRGKESIDVRRVKCKRITPAYAGKSMLVFCASIQKWDHPRLCGEKCPNSPKSRLVTGSPPPMRGKGQSTFYRQMGFGITPAYAGKRSSIEILTRPLQDHPRLCGEKTKKIPKQRYFFHQPASFSFSLQYT